MSSYRLPHPHCSPDIQSVCVGRFGRYPYGASQEHLRYGQLYNPTLFLYRQPQSAIHPIPALQDGVGILAVEAKRREVLSSPTHLVEIDLLRGGKPMRILSETQQTDYRILVCRGNRRPLAQLYAFSVRQEIPKFPLPLQTGDTEPLVDLQSLLVGVYARARYDLAVDYSLEPVPPLNEEDRAWADALLREKGLR